MKTIKYTLILLIFGILCGNIYSQTNTHAFVLDNTLSGNVTSTAYTLSELNLYSQQAGTPSFISAFTYENDEAGASYLHFRRTDPCLGEYENYYNIAESSGSLTVADVKEVKATGNYEIVFCGSNNGQTGYIGMLDRSLNPIRNINGYNNGYGSYATHFNSIVEVPNKGFLVCGEYRPDIGIIIALDYDLNVVSSNILEDIILTDLEYDMEGDIAYMVGYDMNYLYDNNNSLSYLYAFPIDCTQMFGSGISSFYGFGYYSSPYPYIDWNLSGKDDIKILSLGSGTIALAASGKSRTTGQNLGIFYVGDIYGYSSTHNIRYDINGNSVYFKEFVNFGDTYNLLLQEEGSNNPVIVQMNPSQWPNSWNAMRITESVNPDMQMFKREGCQMLEILAFNNDMMNYSDCHSQVVGINYRSIEQQEHFPVRSMPANIFPAVSGNPFYFVRNPDLMPMYRCMRSHINPTTYYQGDCHEDCMGLPTQTNTHAFVQDPGALKGNVVSTAYTLSELDLYCNSTGSPSFISAFTYENNEAGDSYLHFRRTDPCLEEHENYYYVVPNTGIASNGNPDAAFRVTDVKEVKNRTGDFEIVFCGSYANEVAYIGMLDRNLNPIVDINAYHNVVSFNSIIEVPGYGFIACGEGHNNNGVVVAVDYDLNFVSGYEYDKFIFTDIENDIMWPDQAYIAGYSPYELCAFMIGCSDMYNGYVPFQAGFLYSDPNFDIEWNKSGKDDIKIINVDRGSKTIALAASGESRRTGQNLGIFHVSYITGGDPVYAGYTRPKHNIYYDINRSNIYFKEFVNFEGTYNLLLQEEGSNNPLIVEMNPWQGLGDWDAIRITADVNPDMQMFKREDCQMLEILTSKDDMVNYSDCSSQVVGINYQPIEHYERLTVTSKPAYTHQHNHMFPPLNVVHNPHFLPMNPGMNSHINPTVLYRGDCHEYCMRSATAENDDIFENWNEDINPDSENNSVMIYGNIIELQDVANYSEYQIFDIMGRLVVKSKVDKNVISTSGMPNGTYIIHLSKTNGEVEHYKFVRQ